MSGSIRLHKEKGLNPHMTVCPRCGGDSPTLLLLGATNQLYRCKSCDVLHVGRPKLGKCKCGSYSVEFERELGDYERLPGDVCDKCQKELKEHKELVEAGGLFWRCKTCGSEGVIRAESEYAQEIRKRANKPAPEMLGIDFTPEECPVCNKGDEDAESQGDVQSEGGQTDSG